MRVGFKAMVLGRAHCKDDDQTVTFKPEGWAPHHADCRLSLTSSLDKFFFSSFFC